MEENLDIAIGQRKRIGKATKWKKGNKYGTEAVDCG